MSRVYRDKYQTLTLNQDGTFTLQHTDMGHGMHDATRVEIWTATGTYTENNSQVQLAGHRKGSLSGSRTNVPMRRVENYSNTIDDDYNKVLDLSKWEEVNAEDAKNLMQKSLFF